MEKSTWRTHRYFVDFESRIRVEIYTSNQCHNLHVDSPSKIDVISTNFPRGISTSNRCRIDEDVSIGLTVGWGKWVIKERTDILHQIYKFIGGVKSWGSTIHQSKSWYYLGPSQTFKLEFFVEIVFGYQP